MTSLNEESVPKGDAMLVESTTLQVILQANLVCIQDWASCVEVGSLSWTQKLGVKFLGWTQE